MSNADYQISNPAPSFWRNLPEAVLLEPKAYRDSAWSGHVPFAFWIIDVLKPRRLVELGTWYGMSYLAFCQAIQTYGTGTEAFAVDTWQGDEHTGPIAEAALASLRRTHDPLYSDFSTLMQSTFDEAADKIADNSVDLLHIDGLHTYDAVKHDFDSWLPKLTDRAVVLFHDTQVRERGFGVYQLWDELAARYPHFEFHHSYGLGVLGVGGELPDALRQLFAASANPDEAARVRALFSRLGEVICATQSAADKQQELERLAHELDTLKSNLAVRAVMKAQRMLFTAPAAA